MTLKQFMQVGLGLCDHLEAHHNIEEQYFFPLLAERMPVFRRNQELVRQHKVIHGGLDKLREYLSQCGNREREFRLEELKEIMDTFKDVLWTHLDQEVKDLGAENMRKFWSIEDMKAMPG
jgi:hemerythrin-like domain-containing protein